jgi:hypothetical protein
VSKTLNKAVIKATMLRQPFATRQFKKVLAFAPDSKDETAVKAKVKFSIRKQIPFGSSIAVVGECKQVRVCDRSCKVLNRALYRA